VNAVRNAMATIITPPGNSFQPAPAPSQPGDIGDFHTKPSQTSTIEMYRVSTGGHNQDEAWKGGAEHVRAI
jgi:hypothetical protein